jgi:hypothetical protein
MDEKIKKRNASWGYKCSKLLAKFRGLFGGGR